MSTKAIVIANSNKQQLEAQYNMPENFLEYSSGLYLVADFGSSQYKGLLTKSGFNSMYERGTDIGNGFFEVARKVVA